MRATLVRGVRDLTGVELHKHRQIIDIFSHTASLYECRAIDLPILEHASTFSRALGKSSDVFSKEVFSVQRYENNVAMSKVSEDSELVLRPEGTVPVARHFVNDPSVQKKTLPRRYYYSGPFFRHERPQRGRLRQFHQFGVESFSASSCASEDAELISLANVCLTRLGVRDCLRLEINTLGSAKCREKFASALREYLMPNQLRLSARNAKRLVLGTTDAMLRILDNASEQSEKELLEKAPIIDDFLDNEHRERFAEVQSILADLEISFTRNSRLVRGLDYYADTVFEYVEDRSKSNRLGARQGTVLAGGRYSGVVDELGGRIHGVSGVGWASGLERLALLLDDEDVATEGEKCDFGLVYLLEPDEPLNSNSSVVLQLLQVVRNWGFSALFPHGMDSKSQLKRHHRCGTEHCILVSRNLIDNGKVIFRNMRSGEQQEINLYDDAENDEFEMSQKGPFAAALMSRCRDTAFDEFDAFGADDELIDFDDDGRK